MVPQKYLSSDDHSSQVRPHISPIPLQLSCETSYFKWQASSSLFVPPLLFPMLPGDSMLTPTCSCLQHLVGLTCFCLRTQNRARKTYVFANAGSEVMLGWGGGVGGVGMLTFFLVRTLDIATLQRSLVSLLRYMLLRCRDLWYPCYVTCCYAAEISGILATLHVATLRICEGCPARPPP